MKAKILICTVVLIFSAFALIVFAGNEVSWETNYGLNSGVGGAYSAFFGYSAGKNTTGNANTIVGHEAGFGTNSAFTAGNTYIGYQTGYSNTTGFGNFFGGVQAGYTNTIGSGNTFVGGQAGYHSTVDGNTFIGAQAGYTTSTGTGNVFLGTFSGYNTTSANYNTFLGAGAGGYNITGTGDVFLGYSAGSNETGSNKLYIANSSTSTPLIYGDFSGNGIVGINGYLGIGTQSPVRMVHLSGPNAVFRMDRSGNTAGSTSSFQIVRTDTGGNVWKAFVVGVNATGTNTGEFVIWDNGTHLSGAYDRRMTIANNGDVTFPGNVFGNSFGPSSLTLKDNVRTYENALDTVNRLRGVSFDWKDSGKPSVGLIAEEVAKVVPEVVAYKDGAAAGVNYASLVGVLVEAVKEQQKEVDSLKAEVQQLKTLLK
jgi:hypothetical protein